MIRKFINRNSISFLKNQYIFKSINNQCNKNTSFNIHNSNNNNNNNNQICNINKLIHNNNNTSNKYYCSTSNSNTTTNINSTDLSESNLLNNINEIKKVGILPKDGVPKNFIQLKDLIYNTNPDKLNINQRLLASSYLWKYLGITNLTAKTLDRNDLERIWSILDIDTGKLNKEEKEAIELQQLVVCLHSKYLISKLFNLMMDIGKRDIESLSEKMILQSFLASAHLSLWQDMMKYGKRVSHRVLAQLNTDPYFSKENFSYPTILNLLINKEKSNQSIQNIDNSGSGSINNNQIHPYHEYTIHSFGFKNPAIDSENVDKDKFNQIQKDYIDEMTLLKSKISDKDGYVLSSLGEVKYLTILGGAVKLYYEMVGAPQLVCGGILNQDQDNIQLFGNIHFENENNNLVEIQSEYDLHITRPDGNDPNDDAVLSLVGTHKQVQKILSTNESLIYTMDVKINLIKDK